MKYAMVLVNIKGLGVKTFSYLIPDSMKPEIKIGQAVRVPFGRQGLIKAFVVLDKNNTLYVKEELSKLIPQYMMPKVIERIDKMPINKNGKVDREVLNNL